MPEQAAASEYEGVDPEDSYQSLSATAVVALLLGLLAPAVVFGSVLVALPCLAIVVAATALRRIGQSDGALTGRTPALAGLALGFACLCGWFTYNRVEWTLRHSRAAQVAEALLEELTEGSLEGAYLLTLGPLDRAATRTYFRSPEQERESPGNAQPAETPEEKMASFGERPIVSELLGNAQSIRSIRLIRRGDARRVGARRLFVTQTYRIDRSGDAPLECELAIERTATSKGEAFWRVTELGEPKPDA